MDGVPSTLEIKQGAKALEPIRERIDGVDEQMRALFLERMELARQVAAVKARTEDRIYKPDREASILKKRSEGMNLQIVMEYRALLRRVMEISRKYQYGLTLQMRDCFPFPFTQEPPKLRSIAMLREELYICDFCSKDLVITGSDYGQIGRWLKDGQVDGGAGIIEKVGSGVSDALNAMLLREGLYICECRVVELAPGMQNGADDADPAALPGKQSGAAPDKYKVVLFGRTLIVLPEHNRLKLVFVAPNKSGALGSVLCMIADYGVNVTEIHSIPYRDEEDWNYRFFVELEANLLAPQAQALVFQLSQETMDFTILGSYRCEGDFTAA